MRQKLITPDLFLEMDSYFKRGTITASIDQQPHRQGQMAVRLMVEHLTMLKNLTAHRPKYQL